ncbi:UDP-N-acetylglucosamine 2-epimerase (non-hydrolyzing) [Streptomyces sp. MP131-18]|uniref:non-hydrolyzing UDP-N-acetylglucosamine 2-epimerase n=1 Tax=Streptomyces sp. MP131-18 TaxID=1857892 RepID=UPI00097CAB94|nr:UDP-N-acetylglucosamine 2-epimerase (non-hydrolyzing) [Streptomyces sp. MP131-18]ONK15813.1 UDP-N-acetylglucosamine 2-epimerase [Streptomyces sp. MP131-18]
MKRPPTVSVIYGTRPEAIKMAPLVMALRRHTELCVSVVNVGQHKESLMLVPPALRTDVDYQFDISGGLTLSAISTRAWQAVAGVLTGGAADAVVVQGDTSVAFSSALAALYTRTPVIHLEAGLRTWNLDSPFPEEAHRKMISGIARLHLAPTRTAQGNLLREGLAARDVRVVGNTSIDACRIALAAWDRARSRMPDSLLDDPRAIVTFTTHRRENWDRVKDFALAVGRLAAGYPGISFVLPLHPNRLVTDVMAGATAHLPNVHLLGPLPYDDMIKLLTRTWVLVTDSGGLQEEAAFLGVPTVVIRDTTERPEGLRAGVAVLAGIDAAVIEGLTRKLLDSPEDHRRMARPSTCYGDGRAGEKAALAITEFVSGLR